MGKVNNALNLLTLIIDKAYVMIYVRLSHICLLWFLLIFQFHCIRCYDFDDFLIFICCGMSCGDVLIYVLLVSSWSWVPVSPVLSSDGRVCPSGTRYRLKTWLVWIILIRCKFYVMYVFVLLLLEVSVATKYSKC